MKAKINYFEIRGKWNIVINIKEDKISIHNKRWERSAPEAFNFCWDIEYVLDKGNYSMIDTKMRVLEIVYIKEVPEEQKQFLIENLSPLYGQN